MPMNFFKVDGPLQLAKDEELKLRAFAGTPKDADLDGLWNEFEQQETS